MDGEILITGATGFVGSHLVEALAARGRTATALVRPTSDVRVLERYRFGLARGDLDDEATLRSAASAADIVLHLAALTRASNEAEFHEANAAGTRRLVDAIIDVDRPRVLIYLSTLSAVGPARDGRPVGADTTPHPLSAYGRSKLEGERAVASAGAGVRVAVLRPPAVYGPGDRDLLTFFRLARYGVLPVIGDASRRLQLIHAADLAESIVRAMDAPAARGIYHVAEPRAYDWGELLRLVSAAVGARGARIRLPAAGVRAAGAVSEGLGRLTGRPGIFDRDKARELLASWLCETESAHREFGFEATTPLPRGLIETAEWYRAYGWL